MVRAWEHYKLLVWKNYREQLAHPRRLMLIITTPIFFAFVICILNISLKVSDWHPQPRLPVNLKDALDNTFRILNTRQEVLSEKDPNFVHNAFVPRMMIGYAPKYSSFYNDVMAQVETDVHHVEFRSFEKCDELREAVTNKFYFAGVCFLSEQLKSEPIAVNFTLYFPEIIRIYKPELIGARWYTELLFNPNFGIHLHPDITTGTRTYIEEGFLTLQHLVTMACIAQRAPAQTEMPKVLVQQFPYDARARAALKHNLNITLPYCILIGFTFPMMSLTWSIVSEKERELRLVIKLMNARNWIIFCARFTIGVAILFASSILMILLFKINWVGHPALLDNSQFSAVLFLMFAYNVATMCFCYLLSTLLRNTTAMPLALLVWVLTAFPFILSRNSESLTILSKAIMALSLNCQMGLAFSNILAFERYERRFSWKSFSDHKTAQEDFGVGVTIGFLYAISILCVLLGLYLERIEISKQILKNWIRTCFRQRTRPSISSRPSSSYKAEVHEIEPEYKNLTIQLTNLSKEYSGNLIVDNVTLNMYEGEITILRGHNGSGKSVLIKMIAGVVSPTSGKIMIHNCDITHNPDYVGSMLGICLAGNVLFDNLTVEDQLYFFSRMKGMGAEGAKIEVAKYLQAMNLLDKKKVLTRKLTLGLRQYLAVCCALVGQSSIVILEEPTADMDLTAARLLYRMINKEKKGRTILMTSHTHDETQAVADRVAVMSGGRLICSGNPYFLKKIYGQRHRLSCKKGEDCISENVTNIVRKFVPNISPEYEFENELRYLLESKYVEVFAEIIDELEANAERLDLKSYSISESSLEDIFYHKGAEDSSESNRKRHSEIMSGKSVYVEEYNHLRILDKYERTRGLRFWMNILRAIFLKRFILDSRNLLLTASQYTLPIVFAIFVYAFSPDVRPSRLNLLTYNLLQYKSTKTIVDGQRANNPDMQNICVEYSDSIFGIGLHHVVENTNNESFSNYVLRKQRQKGEDFNQYVLGASFSNNQIIAWYNDEMLHSAPLSLNLAHNAILRHKVGKTECIYANLQPVDSRLLPQTIFRYTPNSMGNALAFYLSVSIFIVWTYPVVFIVKERILDFYFMQISTGVSKIALWTAEFLTAFIKKLVISAIVTICIILVEPRVARHLEVIGTCYFAIIGFGISMDMWLYFIQSFFSDPIAAFTFIVCMNFLGSICFTGIIEMTRIGGRRPLSIDKKMSTCMQALPSFTLSERLAEIFFRGVDIALCKEETMELISKILENCECTPACCDYKLHEWMGVMITDVITDFFISFLVLCIAVILYKLVTQIHQIIIDKQNVKNNIGECFGLLGVNGSGKSTLLKMMAGYEKLSYGICLVSGHDVTKNRKQVFQHVGYCSEHDAFLEELTCSETMEIICLFYGMPSNLIPGICENLAKVLGFYPHYHKRISTLSSGSKRRLSCSVAMLGQPSLLLLDNPTSTIDPAGKRQLWNVMGQFRRHGTSIVITTLNPLGAEIISDRIAIISEGILQCIGKTFYLTDKYARGYHLKVSIRNVSHAIKRSVLSSASRGTLLQSRRSLEGVFLKLMAFMEKQFPNSRLRDHRGNWLHFTIPLEGNTATGIYDEIYRNALTLNIEDFVITLNNISIVLADITEKDIVDSAYRSFVNDE